MDADGESLETAMRRMKELGAAHVVTTLGSSGSAYLNEDGKVCTISGYKVPAVDTTGAGDCYNAGLAIAITQGKSLDKAVDYAGLVSALAVTKFGAQAGMPTEEEVQHFAAEQKRTGE
ncbi:Ribokinase [compost metagenome]